MRDRFTGREYPKLMHNHPNQMRTMDIIPCANVYCLGLGYSPSGAERHYVNGEFFEIIVCCYCFEEFYMN
ncbi:hypothetical protein [Spiroplasma endosymbiont of Aspidapion aeneum]|uniref:hypothetical protein n=1 Tax=Spiroplasma endosymbiont of Aspidapion aeneum TaxID=3066276 RepID=UPI00313C0C27